MSLSLPIELWIYILEIKWWTARVNRLEKALEFPIPHDGYRTIVGRHIFEIIPENSPDYRFGYRLWTYFRMPTPTVEACYSYYYYQK
jgi:hypothetical protein